MDPVMAPMRARDVAPLLIYKGRTREFMTLSTISEVGMPLAVICSKSFGPMKLPEEAGNGGTHCGTPGGREP